jgi:hypothetical protein
MTNAEYVERELRRALKEGAGGPVETVRVKAEGPTGDSRWLALPVDVYEVMITATVEAVAEREE